MRSILIVKIPGSILHLYIVHNQRIIVHLFMHIQYIFIQKCEISQVIDEIENNLLWRKRSWFVRIKNVRFEFIMQYVLSHDLKSKGFLDIFPRSWSPFHIHFDRVILLTFMHVGAKKWRIVKYFMTVNVCTRSNTYIRERHEYVILTSYIRTFPVVILI